MPGYEFFLGLRYLKSKRKSALVSLITVISVAGVTVGVMALIIVLAVMSGFEEDFKAKILGTNSHVIVVSTDRAGLAAADAVLARVRRHAHVVDAAPFVFSQVMLTTEGNVSGVVIRGVVPDAERRVTNVTRHMVAGDLSALRGPLPAAEGDGPARGIVLGRELASILGVYLGDPVNVVSPLGRITPVGMVPKMMRFRVVGIFDSGLYQYDTGLAYISLKDAQAFFDMGDRVTGIEVRLDDIYRAREVRRALQADLGPGYLVKDWTQMNRQLFSALRLEKVTMFIILSLIILVAALNIISTLTMVVMEKRKEIAVLKAMGARRSSIMKIFMVEGMIIGLAGTALGCALGLLVALNLEAVVGFLEATFHFKIIDASVYYIDRLPSTVKVLDVAAVVLMAMGISLCSTLYPAFKASTLDPVEALRYE